MEVQLRVESHSNFIVHAQSNGLGSIPRAWEAGCPGRDRVTVGHLTNEEAGPKRKGKVTGG